MLLDRPGVLNVHHAPAGIGGYSPLVLALLLASVLGLSIASMPRGSGADATSSQLPDPPLPWIYDAEAVAVYWARR